MTEHLSDRRRRRLGAHYTPDSLARHLTALAWADLGRSPRLVLDPSCGGGAFLIAAAERFLDDGVPASEIVSSRLVGFEIDAKSAQRARELLRDWARAHGGSSEPKIFVLDALGDGTSGVVPTRPDLVIGNPPFLSQLAADTAMDPDARDAVAQRFGVRAAYTDVSALHLLAGIELVAADGLVCMVQPESVLGARDAQPVRSALVDSADLVGLWASAESHFDAQVRVCAPLLRKPAGVSRSVRVYWEQDSFSEFAEIALTDPTRWSPLLATVAGVPDITIIPGDTIGDVANVTAGFRDEFYSVAACTRQGSVTSKMPRVITSGGIDPLRCLWGERPAKIAGIRYSRPVLDLESLKAESTRVEAWVLQRLVPKVVVASQTKVIEAAVDPLGELVPLTPVVSVEPTRSGITPAMLGVALSAPSLSAVAVQRAAGTGRSSEAIRVSASAVAGLPIPADLDLWREVTNGCSGSIRDLGRRLDQLFATRIASSSPDGQELALHWWLDRLPKRRAPESTG